jgi:hypothetical protein
MLLFALVGSLLGGGWSWAQLQDMPKEAFQYEVVDFKPLKGHHFELHATQSCTPAVMVSTEGEKISCQFNQLGPAKVVFSVCDDKKTFCRTNRLEIMVKSPPAGQKGTALQPGLVQMKEELHEELLPHFQSVSVEKAKELGREKGLPLFVMISTDWCPPCNQSKEYLISTPAFEDFSQSFTKIYVDGDSQASMEYDREIPFFEYPSFVLLNSHFQEVSRFVGELAYEEFVSWWSRTAPFLLEGYDSVKKRVLERKQDSWWRGALDFLSLRSDYMKERELHFVIEEAMAVNDKDVLDVMGWNDIPDFLKERWLSSKEDQLVPGLFSKEELLKKEIEFSGLTPQFVDHLKEICTLKLADCDSLKKELPQRPQRIMERPDRNRAENLAALADEYYAQMDFYRSFHQKEQSEQAAKKCVETFEEMIPLSHLKHPRYAMQGILVCARAYDVRRVGEVYKKMMKQYPEDPTFILRYSRYLKDDLKDLSQAKVWSEKAMAASYDFNWFYAASLNIQIDQALGLKKQALAVVKEAFSRLQLSENKDSRHQKVLSRFRELERSLNE